MSGSHSPKLSDRGGGIWADKGKLPEAYQLYPHLLSHHPDGLGLAYVWLIPGGKLVGYMSLSKEGEDAYELHNLAVLPEYRHLGFGKQLLEHAKETVKALGGNIIKIGIIEESTVLKQWYEQNGFVHTGTKKFDHLPFTSGNLEYSL